MCDDKIGGVGKVLANEILLFIPEQRSWLAVHYYDLKFMQPINGAPKGLISKMQTGGSMFFLRISLCMFLFYF